MIKDIKFLATTVQPNPKEVTHWVDLNEDPTGGIIKTFDGKDWKSITSSNSDSDKYVNITIELNTSGGNEITIDGKVYDFIHGIIYDTDLLNYLKNIYNSDKSLIVDYTERSHNREFNIKSNTYVMYGIVIKNGTSYEICDISLLSFKEGLIIEVLDTDYPGQEPV